MEANAGSADPTVPWCDGVGVRVSAHLRRGAAPYADGCSQILVVFTPNFPLILR